jgi:predicted nuclease of restriction endonuclease-like (RecB) superfamily
MKSKPVLSKEYKTWLEELKHKVRNAQLKAAVKVNSEMLLFYWEMGADIVFRQAKAKWGEGLLVRLSKDLMSEFPEMKGFSLSNLKYIKQWYLFYSDGMPISQQPVGQITKKPVSQSAVNAVAQDVLAQITTIPWGHNIAIISKFRDTRESLFYVKNTVEHNWSRNVLVHQIESGLYKLTHNLPKNLKSSLPTIEEIEKEFAGLKAKGDKK